MMFVFELPTIPKGEIVVHSDCHCCQLLSKWLVWFSCWLYCSSYHIKRFGKRSIKKKMFWKRLIETFIFLTVEASRHFSGIIFFEIFLMIFNGFIFVNWWNYFILWNEKRKMKMDKRFGALTLVESGSLNFLKKLASGTFLWAPYM